MASVGTDRDDVGVFVVLLDTRVAISNGLFCDEFVEEETEEGLTSCDFESIGRLECEDWLEGRGEDCVAGGRGEDCVVGGRGEDCVGTAFGIGETIVGDSFLIRSAVGGTGVAVDEVEGRGGVDC